MYGPAILLGCFMYFIAFPPPFTHIVAQRGRKDECVDKSGTISYHSANISFAWIFSRCRTRLTHKPNCFLRAIRLCRQDLQIRVCYWSSGFRFLFAYDLLSILTIKKPAEFLIQSVEKMYLDLDCLVKRVGVEKQKVGFEGTYRMCQDRMKKVRILSRCRKWPSRSMKLTVFSEFEKARKTKKTGEKLRFSRGRSI